MLALATGYGHSKKHGKGHKSVKGHSGHKGHKGKKFGKKHEDHWSKHSNAKGKHSKGHHDSKKYHGDHHKGSKGHKGAKFGKKGHKHKGHVTKGFKNTYHKNEFSKKTKFYDSFDNGGYHKKFGGYKAHYGGSKGNKLRGGKLSGFFKGGKFGKKHHHDKGKHFDEHKGSKGHYEEKGSYGHKSHHKKGGKGHGHGHKHHGYGHKHHDHGYGHSGHIPTYVAPDHLEQRQYDEGEDQPVGQVIRGDKYYDKHNGYNYAREDEEKKLYNNKKGDVDEEEGEPQDEEVTSESRSYQTHTINPDQKDNEDEQLNPKEYHKDDLYKTIGEYFAQHYSPTESNFTIDNTDLGKNLNVSYKGPIVNKNSLGSYKEEDPEVTISDEKYNKPLSKSDNLAYIEDDINPYTNTRAQLSLNEMKNSRENEWPHNPNEIMQQDEQDDFITTKRTVIRKDKPLPPIPSPLSRIVYQDNSQEQKIDNHYHPFSGFYYKNAINSV